MIKLRDLVLEIGVAHKFKEGDTVTYNGRRYTVEKVSDLLVHLALKNPEDRTEQEKESGHDGKISVNPKFLKPVIRVGANMLPNENLKRAVKEYKKRLKEIEVASTGNWEDADMSSIDADTMDEIFQLYKKTYEAEGMDLSVNSGEEMRADYKALKMQDVDGDQQADCFIVYKPVPGYGNKIALLFTNKKPGSARELITKVVDLCKSGGWFIEASKKMEDVMSKSGAPVIEDEETIKGIIGPSKAKTVKFLGDGYYERKLGAVDKMITKRLYGSVG